MSGFHIITSIILFRIRPTNTNTSCLNLRGVCLHILLWAHLIWNYYSISEVPPASVGKVLTSSFSFTNFFFLAYIFAAAAAAAKSLQSCLTLCNPIDSSPSSSPVPGILKARTLEWVAISFSNAWKWKVKVKSLSRVWLLATPWSAAYQAPPSMGFSRQEYWSGVPLPSPAYLSNKT